MIPCRLSQAEAVHNQSKCRFGVVILQESCTLKTSAYCLDILIRYKCSFVWSNKKRNGEKNDQLAGHMKRYMKHGIYIWPHKPNYQQMIVG